MCLSVRYRPIYQNVNGKQSLGTKLLDLIVASKLGSLSLDGRISAESKAWMLGRALVLILYMLVFIGRSGVASLETPGLARSWKSMQPEAKSKGFRKTGLLAEKEASCGNTFSPSSGRGVLRVRRLPPCCFCRQALLSCIVGYLVAVGWWRPRERHLDGTRLCQGKTFLSL